MRYVPVWIARNLSSHCTHEVTLRMATAPFRHKKIKITFPVTPFVQCQWALRRMLQIDLTSLRCSLERAASEGMWPERLALIGDLPSKKSFDPLVYGTKPKAYFAPKRLSVATVLDAKIILCNSIVSPRLPFCMSLRSRIVNRV